MAWHNAMSGASGLAFHESFPSQISFNFTQQRRVEWMIGYSVHRNTDPNLIHLIAFLSPSWPLISTCRKTYRWPCCLFFLFSISHSVTILTLICSSISRFKPLIDWSAVLLPDQWNTSHSMFHLAPEFLAPSSFKLARETIPWPI